MKTKLLYSIKLIFYVFIFFLSTNRINAQSPGGVASSITLWLKTDVGVTTDTGASLDQWSDQSGNGHLFEDDDGNEGPDLVSGTTTTFNFNDFLDHSGGTRSLRDGSASGLVGSDAATLFLVFNKNGINQTAFTAKDGNGEITQLSVNGGFIDNDGFADFKSGANSSDLDNKTIIVGLRDQIPNDGEVEGIYNGSISLNTALSNSVANTLSNNASKIGTDNDFHFSGMLSEIIVYQTKLSDSDVQKVSSYLALKYGITLEQTSPLNNYLASDGSIIWDSTVNASYNVDVFGIGEDSGSALNQKVSQSVNNANGPILATTQHFTQANNDALRTSSLGNGNFIVMGHDDGSNTFTESYNGNANIRLGRTWRIDKSGSTGSIYIAIPKASYSFPMGTPTVILSDDSTFDTSDTFADLSDDGTFYWAEINPSDGQYLTFASTTAGFTVSQSALIISENGGTDTFSVVLDKQPASDVVLNVSSDDIGEAIVNKPALTFTSADWFVAQTVTVTGVDDNIVGEQSAVITISIDQDASNDEYDSLGNSTIDVSLTDDDDDTLGIESIPDLNFSFYPNPAEETVFLMFNKNINKPKLSVFDTLGKEIQSIDLELKNHKGYIDVSQLSKGIYLFKITDEEGSSLTKRLIVK